MHEQISLLKQIEDKLGKEIKEQIEELTYKSSLYVLYAVSYHKVTKLDLDAGYASYHVRYPERTFEDFLRYKRNWNEDQFTFTIEAQGYFVDRKTAVDYAESNMADINEAGSFPFIIISSMPLNTMYPMCNFRDHTLFHFNTKTNKYEEVDWDYDDATAMLKSKANNGWY